MIRASLLALFSTLIICGFCGIELLSLGRHSWHCKSKFGNHPETTQNVNLLLEVPSPECLRIKSSKALKCCCGKIYKGVRGLNRGVH